MWLTTPRFLAGLALLAAFLGLVVAGELLGSIGEAAARAIYAASAALIVVAIVWRSRARLR